MKCIVQFCRTYKRVGCKPGKQHETNGIMTKKQQKLKTPPIWIVISVILSIFIGIFGAIVGIDKIRNYYHPYLFGLIFGGIGVVIGIWFAKKVKRHIAFNPQTKQNYFTVILFIATGFFGVSLMLCSFLNQGLSEIDKCDKYQVINKYRQESRFRQPEINSLVVDLNGKSFRLVCSRDFWFSTSNGQEIDLCLHSSKLGFDFISITNDKNDGK